MKFDNEVRGETVNTREKSYITPYGLRKLQAEYDDFRHNKRPKMVEEVSVAAAMGDRSENAAYIYGKKRLREIDSRLRFLDTRMQNVAVVDPATIQRDDITFGATVKLEYEDGQIKTFHLVGIDEVDVKRNRISYKSPVGRALMGKRVDDDVLVRRPAGPVEVSILDIKYLPIED